MNDEKLSPEAEEAFGNALHDVFSHILEKVEKERRASKPYQDLFKKSEQGLNGILSNAHTQIDNIVLTTVTVIQDKFELPRISNKLFELIKALPFVHPKLEEEITNTEGFSCCVDKAYHVYYQEVLEEINRIKNE